MHEAAGWRDAVSRAIARDKPGDIDGHPGILVAMDEVKVVVAHSERATLRVGDVFLKVDADQARIDVEVEAMALAPVPTPTVDRKSTRLNSSHTVISYAVFCL